MLALNDAILTFNLNVTNRSSVHQVFKINYFLNILIAETFLRKNYDNHFEKDSNPIQENRLSTTKLVLKLWSLKQKFYKTKSLP